MNVSEFLPDYCTAVKLLIDNKKGYYAFGPICIGIEVLGRCLDDTVEFHDTTKPPHSYFDKAINDLMPDYIGRKLYDDLRNGLIHTLKPKYEIWLREKHNASSPNLSKKIPIRGAKRTVIIIEDFYEAFEKACKLVIQKIIDGEINHHKLKDVFILTTE